MARFATVGALGTVLNLLLMWLLMREVGLHYLAAAVVSTEIAILHNFLLQERLVFRDLRDGRHGWWMRAAHSVLYNNADTLVRLPLLALLVEVLGVPSVPGQALTLAVAFLARFFFVSTVVYGPRRGTGEALGLDAGPVDVLLIAPVLAGRPRG
jgi:dolichol-phosphate mannosyltransferase